MKYSIEIFTNTVRLAGNVKCIFIPIEKARELVGEIEEMKRLHDNLLFENARLKEGLEAYINNELRKNVD